MSHATSAPIPIPNTQPTELHELITAKRWPDAIERCQAHPHEVGSSSHLRNQRGYTALHTLMAYSHSTPGEELVPVVKAILRAADEINYGEEHKLGRGEEGNHKVEDEHKINTNEIVADEGSTTQIRQVGGSWRLLLDQNNRAQWSPLHLICVQGGICHGKVTVIRTLLQMDVHENDEELNKYRQQILTLLDRQNRNILHHLLDIVVPSDIDAIRDIVGLSPSLLFQRDNREKTPLQYVIDRVTSNPGTRRRHYMNSYGNNDEGLQKNYQMLKLLVRCMGRETWGWGEGSVDKRVASLVPEADQKPNYRGEHSHSIPRNVLQSACLLPRSVCPPDGSLITFLASEAVFKLEAKVREDAKSSSINMAEETDINGNRALHLFASNQSYVDSSDSEIADHDAPGTGVDPDNDTSHSNIENKIMEALLCADRKAVQTPNSNGELPLQIAMRSGLRHAVARLVVEYPEAVLLYDSFDNIKLVMHILSCISVPRHADDDDGRNENHRLTTMFDLVRARPDIVSLAGSSKPEPESKQEDSGGGVFKKKWWRSLNPFSQKGA